MANRLLYHPHHVQALRGRLRGVLDEAKADLHAMHRRHVAELAELRAELAELRSIFQDVVRTLRVQAETDVATLRRQLETALVRLERRDSAQPLH